MKRFECITIDQWFVYWNKILFNEKYKKNEVQSQI